MVSVAVPYFIAILVTVLDLHRSDLAAQALLVEARTEASGAARDPAVRELAAHVQTVFADVKAEVQEAQAEHAAEVACARGLLVLCSYKFQGKRCSSS